MSRYEVLDTFPAFDRFWRAARTLLVDQQIEAWRRDYLRPWPELFRKQATHYRQQGVDWRGVARRRIFPAMDARIVRMRTARTNLRHAIPVTTDRARRRLGLDFSPLFVIHVGIGCGAGWATTFGGEPAVLFGLENAVESEWTERAATKTLVGHELAHLIHDRWRKDAATGTLDRHRGPWWQLYEEGFATRCEALIGGALGHRPSGPEGDWLPWCDRNRARLASLFLKTVSARKPVRRFFGSWYRVDGYIETGYYLGSEVIADWESRFSLREIAGWPPDEIRRRARISIRQMAAAG